MENNSISEPSIIEIYKEYGAYERHFNNIQNLFKGLSSTWFLAGFTAIGYIFNSNPNQSIPIATAGIASLIALVVATGIVLFWIMDILVYHKLLRATIEVSQDIEEKYLKSILSLRNTMKGYTSSLNVRVAISIFYVVPGFILIATSILFANNNWSNGPNYINYIISTWIGLLLIGNILVLIFQKRKSK